MKNLIYLVFIGLFCFTCNNPFNNSSSFIDTAIINIFNRMNEYEKDSNNDTLTYQMGNSLEEEESIEDRKVKFSPHGMIKIGPKREYKSLGAFFSEVDEAQDVHLVIDDGTYYESRIYVRGHDVIIEGTGPGVNIYCTEYGENVMEVSHGIITII